MKLFLQAFSKFTLGLLLTALLLFLPAGSFAYTNAWLFIALLFIPIFILGIFLFLKSPILLKKRLESKEEERTQKGVILLSSLLFIFGFVVAGLDFRFSWSSVPLPVVIIASLVLLLSYALYAEVMRENAYLSRTVKVEKAQRVVDTGLYGIVRHPMYAATVFLFLSIPLVLGSFFSFLCFLPYVALIVVRIFNEEKLLSKKLEGYADYQKRVKYRLIPFLF